MSLVLHVRLRCSSLSITTLVSLVANSFDVRSALHGQVSLAAVNQIYVIHGAMNGCTKLKFIKGLLFIRECIYIGKVLKIYFIR